MSKLPLLAACALAFATPAFAGDDAAPAAPADTTTPAAPVKEKKVCQRINETGSRGYTKVCQTEAQWRAQREADRRDVKDRDSGGR